jgi:cysteinyl-tRNA synthetase
MRSSPQEGKTLADPIELYDTGEHRVRELETIEPDRVRLYVCGISVSGPPHVGHGRSYVIFDVLRRVLEHAGYEVDHVQNFTDVEHAIMKRAEKRGLEPLAYAEQMIEAYFDAMDRIAIKRADRFPRVTDYIDDIIDATRTLEDHECAYEIDDGVAFRICDVEGFGTLLGKVPADAVVHEVPEEQWNGRETPFDFIVWRNTDDLGVTWKTSFGEGRPGWHTECAVMANDLLGETIDIHGGGADLVFPHHECERAIARCLTDSEFANYWVHNGLVTLDEEKMSKSLRNSVPLSGAIDDHGPAQVRLAYLSEDYRETMEWNDARLADADERVQALHDALQEAAEGTPAGAAAELRDEAIGALRSNLDFPAALEALDTVGQQHTDAPGARQALIEVLDVLGLAELEPFASEVGSDDP